MDRYFNLKNLLLILLFLTTLGSQSFAGLNENVEYRDLTDPNEVYTFLFLKHFELRDPNCHRQVHESRSPKTMIAMGCQLFRLEIDKSELDEDKIQFKGHYRCNGKIFPFTAHCFLKKN